MSNVSKSKVLLGRTLHFSGDPFSNEWSDMCHVEENGAVFIRDGVIVSVGSKDSLKLPTDADVTDMGDALLMAGFVDAHVHYPQTAIIASWGKRLIDWLNDYTFPEEARFGDAAYAKEIAGRYFELALANGTTTSCSYTTTHPESVDAFFGAAQTRGLRVVAGKTCMDRNAPENLIDTVQSAYDDSKALLEKWHGKDRLSYAITPRFAPTSTRDQLNALGALWAEHPDCLMQTHLSEQVEEISWVKELFPDAKDYLDVYEKTGLFGARGVYGHSIHLTAREIARLSEGDAALAHCPTSNTFIGSGLFQLADLVGKCRIGLATDTGGGSSFSMLRTMAAAYEIAQLTGNSIHPAQLLWLATVGSASALHLDDKIGNLAPGKDADIVAIDLNSTPAISQRAKSAENIWQAIFPTIMMGDDRAIKQVWVSGQPAL